MKNRIANQSFTTGAARALLYTLLLVSATVTAFAQGGNGTYDVSHKFNFTPQGDVVSGTWRYYAFTSASPPTKRCGPLKGSEAMPVTDSKDCASSVNNAQSKAHSGIITTNFQPGNVSGTIGVKGFATATGNPGAAFSAARSGVTVRGGKKMRNGRIKWGPAQNAQVQGQASASIHDPIAFDVFNPDDNSHTTGTLLDIEAFLIGGSFNWSGDAFDLNAKYFDFTIQINSPFTTEQGTVDFHVRNGIVTGSAETGMFAGLLPSVGSSGNFSVPFSNDITLDYNLGNMGGNNPDVSFFFDGGGEAVAGTPEPGTLLLLGSGLVGFGGLLRKRLFTRS